MFTLDEMRLLKKQMGYSNQEIADKSGVPYSTVQKLLSGTTTSPRHETLSALNRFFSTAIPAYHTVQSLRSKDASMVSDNTAPYYSKSEKKQGEYTLEDYLALPDDQRVELIDGVFYVMFSPSMPHQLISGELYRIISNHIREKGGNCIPFIAPADVQLDCDNRTIVQPDVFIVCDRSKIHHARCYGAPDMIIEVLSSSTKKKDMFIKLNKYQNAGVREYWMIDLKNERIIVYQFERDDLVTIYGFSDSVPVGIYDGELQINFKEITDYFNWIQNWE